MSREFDKYIKAIENRHKRTTFTSMSYICLGVCTLLLQKYWFCFEYIVSDVVAERITEKKNNRIKRFRCLRKSVNDYYRSKYRMLKMIFSHFLAKHKASRNCNILSSTHSLVVFRCVFRHIYLYISFIWLKIIFSYILSVYYYFFYCCCLFHSRTFIKYLSFFLYLSIEFFAF